MPTSRPRHTITETDEIARALDEAARRWPGERHARGRLLLRLVEEGYQALREESAQVAEGRRAAVARTSGILTGDYGDRYLDDLRSEWPE
ncbi:MAG: hypothetical protein J2P40_14210 [Candidatus Dormibacteraeota bacterium]|nr:hypothetical protein [Candidatus Dormibacteraeota bacterium]MBO0762425.1 hypothetical protein [Candidatus Dormibacteraeota bacterium]